MSVSTLAAIRTTRMAPRRHPLLGAENNGWALLLTEYMIHIAMYHKEKANVYEWGATLFITRGMMRCAR